MYEVLGFEEFHESLMRSEYSSRQGQRKKHEMREEDEGEDEFFDSTTEVGTCRLKVEE